MDTLTPEALGWALTHVGKYGDTDIFPVPFEYSALRAHWLDVSGHLNSIDLGAHQAAPSLRLLAPKSKLGFRAVEQLDPYDQLLYLGMVFEAAGPIEIARMDRTSRVACSYRVEITPDGQLFSGTNGWSDFHGRSQELVANSSITHVLMADIADFYNQIYHHRVQSSLESAGVNRDRSHNIERFVGTLTARQTRGVPVGSAASTLLAEACLADVDSFLLRRGHQHTRYVDDFRVFTTNRMSAIQALYDLTHYLHTVHRLCLQSGKTRIHEKERFIREELVDPEQRELVERMSRLNEMLGEMGIPTWYDEPGEIEVTPEMENQAVRDALRSLFHEVVSAEKLHLGFARYLLRRGRGLRSRVLLPDVLEHLERLLPVLRDVVQYVLTVYPRTDPQSVGAALVGLLRTSEFRLFPFVQLWILHALSEAPGFCQTHEALALAEGAHPFVRDRCCALIARSHKVVDWVRERKESWANTDPWVQRAILWAGAILPADERLHWLEPVTRGTPHINAIIAKAANRGLS